MVSPLILANSGYEGLTPSSGDIVNISAICNISGSKLKAEIIAFLLPPTPA